MDKLDVIHRAEQLGGESRRTAIIDLIVNARKLACKAEIGGGRAGGINLRYGSIGYAIMDVNTNGQIKLYVQPHPGKSAPDALSEALNDCIDSQEGLKPKSFPIQNHGQLAQKVEDVPADALNAYLSEAVRLIEDTYYRPHIEAAAALH